MSVSPYVKFNFENNNVVETTPLMGVSCILTRTTKGPFNDPSTVIQSYAQFQREFGEEIIAGGSVSQVQKALELGSKLRVIRVLGQTALPGEYGFSPQELTEETNSGFDNQITLLVCNEVNFNVGIKYIGQQSDSFKLTVLKTTKGSGEQATTTISYTITDCNNADMILESNTLITFQNHYDIKASYNENVVRSVLTSVDYNTFCSAIDNSNYLKPYNESDYSKFVSLLRALDQSTEDVDISAPNTYRWIRPNFEKSGPYPGDGGIDFNNTNTIVGCWKTAVESLLDYTDVYQVACAFLPDLMEKEDGTTNNELLYQIHSAIADVLIPLQEYTYYIEVPKDLTEILDYPGVEGTISGWIQRCMGAVGNSKYVAYFAGGIKYYNDMGRLVNSDVIGTILGLGDASATNYGPWRSFAGMNRGVIWDGQGPVCPNYGSPSKYNYLNQLAGYYANMIVVKDTASSGKQTMLWHLFTSQVKQDSERFLSIVRLNLYLKKTLRPILENYLEEPNTWGTWKNIYLKVKPILDDLITQQAMTEYHWMGDQDATSYDSLTVNNEADVRQGKYKVILKYKDIVPMQEITINITIDAASQSVSIDSDSSNA